MPRRNRGPHPDDYDYYGRYGDGSRAVRREQERDAADLATGPEPTDADLERWHAESMSEVPGPADPGDGCQTEDWDGVPF